MLSTPRLCSYAAVVVWAWAGYAAGSYDEFMSCGSKGGPRGDREGKDHNFHYRPEVPCDLARNGWCETAGNQYPWDSVKRFVYENQGLMKRMYGDQRHISVLRSEFVNDMGAPDVYKYQPNLSEPPPVASSRNPRKGKKIQRNGRADARAMEVTMEPEINKNVPISKTAQKKSTISSSKTYSSVSNKGNGQETRQKVSSRNRPPKAPPSERRRVPVKYKLKTKSKVDNASSTTSTTSASSTKKDTTATSTTPVSPSTSAATTLNTKDESTESTRTTKQMQDQITTMSDTIKADSEPETTIRSNQPNSDTTSQTNQSSSTEEVTTTVQDTIEPTTNDPTTTSGGESTVEIDSYTTVEEDTESATLLQAEFREGSGPILYDGGYESTYDSFALYEKPIGGPLRHSDTLTTAPGRTQETFSSYTSISSDAAPPSSLTANMPSLTEITKEYESSTARSEFPLDFGDDFLSASHDDGDLETIMFEEEFDAIQKEPRPLSPKERIAQDYRASTEGSDLTTISLAERIDQAVDVRITGSSYPKDEIDLAMEETIATDASLAAEHRRGEEVEIEDEEEIVENVENNSDKPPEPVRLKPLKGINACPVKGEVQSPYWANNTRGEVLALLNMYPFEQYIHMEKCLHENRQMYCRNGCRCEQQYRLHRLLAFDPINECRGIFSDWFSFPSCCVCKCYNLHHNIFEGTSRRPRLHSNPDEEYYDYDEEDYYNEDEEDEESDEAEYITDGDYVIEDFKLDQFEHQATEEESRRNQRAQTGSVPPSKITPQRAPRPFSRPKSHIAPPSPSLLPPSPNLLPPPTSGGFNKRQSKLKISPRRTVDTATQPSLNDSTWIRENGRALPLFRIPRNTPENEEEEKHEKK